MFRHDFLKWQREVAEDEDLRKVLIDSQQFYILSSKSQKKVCYGIEGLAEGEVPLYWCNGQREPIATLRVHEEAGNHERLERKDVMRLCLTGNPYKRTIGHAEAIVEFARNHSALLLCNSYPQFLQLAFVNGSLFEYVCRNRLLYTFAKPSLFLVIQDFAGRNIGIHHNPTTPRS